MARRRINAATMPNRFLGGYAEGVTPVPIPNTEVKPLRADDTARVAVWESRSPPGINNKAPRNQLNGCGALFSWNDINIVHCFLLSEPGTSATFHKLLTIH